MNPRIGAGALFLALIAFGVFTTVPVLFNFLGLALYVALMRECGRHVWPREWLPKWMRRTANPAPPPGPERGSEEKPQVVALGNGEGYIVYPNGRRTEKT